MKTLLRSSALALTFVATAAAAVAQSPCPSAPVTDHGKPMNGKPLASPPMQAEMTLAGNAVTIRYNAPSMRCRKIMGGVVPYGQVWRTGANPATSLVTAADLTIGDLHVPAGSYTLYTLPNADPSKWLLIVNKQTGQWGTVYKPEQDLGRTPMKHATLPAPQEVMSISFENVKGNSAELHIRWEWIDEYVTVTAR